MSAEEGVVVRVLVDKNKTGGIIGKAGAAINQIRQDSGVQVEVGAQVQGAHKRIVTITGKLDGVIKALHMITFIMVAIRQEGDLDESTDHHIVLLVQNSYVGAIIGKGGATITALRQQTGSGIKVSEKTLGYSSEKTVTLKGEQGAVAEAITQIMCIFAQQPGNTSTENLYWPQPSEQYLKHMYGEFVAHNGISSMQGQHMQQGMFNQPFPSQFPRGQGGKMAAGETPETIIVPIPETLIGFVIGRKGENINEIRKRSGATIKINEKIAGSTERIVNITGGRAANEVAVALINERLSQYDAKHSA